VSRGQRGGSPTVVNLSFLDRGLRATEFVVCLFVLLGDYSDEISANYSTTVSPSVACMASVKFRMYNLIPLLR
jgi:hypothetical protein